MPNNHPSLGPLMLDISGLALDGQDCELLVNPMVGGIILFSRNYASPSQLKELVSSIRSIRPHILIAVDQEGGRVQRFRQGFLALPALRLIGKEFERDAEQGLALAKTCGWAMAAEIIHYGLDFSFAPVMDLYNSSSEIIEDRAFSANVGVTCTLLEAYIDGMNSAGMRATGKHFPGHGSVRADSHIELPIDNRSASEILDNDYQVFVRCIGKLGGIMPAHVKYPALDDHCAGYSRFWIQQKLRSELEFQGVVFSDDLTMVAATDAGSISQRAQLAIEAGCNMVLVCNNRGAALEALEFLNKVSSKLAPDNAAILAKMSATKNTDIDLYTTEKWRSAVSAIAAISR